ncbi:hypothetical protein DFH08DRAFT_997652 [Mycena albidolilacea]|uniref:F-box domain-containing protein n=1 Tax=Mycena albidolilacea TaxID=1033008 RepID=A0AAD6YXI2_9AGAR|nr:hypothetical protein DFH08DRAFT_997652 [Mycena albidolilacea]
MNWVPQAAVDSLPDDVLATILKLVADLPVLSSERTPPAPVAASRVSRRWRIVALGSPELWTNIRISYLSGSRRWAATFVKRSLSRPLDISINLESHRGGDGWGNPYCIPDPLNKVLAIVGPHIGRWRGRLLLLVEKLFGSESFFSLRVKGMGIELGKSTAFKALRSVDVEYQWNEIAFSESFRRLFGPWSTVTTLIIRDFHQALDNNSIANFAPIDCSTIRSFSISFSPSFYHPWPEDYPDYGGFEAVADTFNLPNIEYLEIRGGFTGIPYNRFRIPEDWEAPLFPHLRTLRLEDVEFGRAGLSVIQSFSRDITALQLINTAENQHLLVQPGAWPALRALTVEAPEVPEWIAPFVAMRSALGRPILDLTLSLCDRDFARTLAARNARSALAIHLQHSGPSPALRDGVYGPGFYVNECNMRPADFKQSVRVRTGHYCVPGWELSLCPECRLEQDKERVEEEIEGDFKFEGEVAGSKGTQREARKQRRRAGEARSASWGSKAKRFSRNRRRGFIEDFSIV